ncbi:MAG: DUF1501 domain-containing protein, partial [Candidatus Omnitrophica bacterium]|nr:DUF1501 domain-containing protein [Candidatus Omnitrophota bacterium]
HGGPSQVDTFDYKPQVGKKPHPGSVVDFKRNISAVPKLLKSPWKFSQHGESGLWASELFPEVARHMDDLCVIRSMHTEGVAHGPSTLFLHCGATNFIRPSMGSWITYGLGTENQDLPGFVVLVSGNKTPSAGKSVWGSGFLPTVYQGVQCRTSGDPVLYLSNPEGMDRDARRRTLDAIRDLNEMQLAKEGDPETQTRIAQYELAFRMQMSVPEVMDISKEPQEMLDHYGANPGESSFANNCLLARRLVEQGVRFVQLFDWGWDTHGTGPSDDIVTQLPKKCGQTDKPMSALIKDLKQRGLLDETIVVWSGEFGRTAMNEERNGSTFLGRDHHPHCFTMWMAGGGFKRGESVGATDELGYHITEAPIHVHDFQATLLNQLGMDHKRLTFRFQGRDYRLTDVHGEVRQELLA